MWAETEQRPHSAQQLPEQAVMEWEKIPQETIDGLITRMPEGMQAVLDANGGHTKWLNKR